MKRTHEQSEENFWPCVSDMFLALFIIALVLYSITNAEKGKGDEYISNLANEAAKDLIELVQTQHPETDILQGRAAGDLDPEAKGFNRPEMAEALYRMSNDTNLREYFKTDSEDAWAMKAKLDSDSTNFRAVIRYVYLVNQGKKWKDEDPRYDVALTEVRRSIENTLVQEANRAEESEGDGGPGGPDQADNDNSYISQAQDDLLNAREKLADADSDLQQANNELNDTREALQEKQDNLQRATSGRIPMKPEDIQKLKQEIDELSTEIRNLQSEINSNKSTHRQIELEINKINDEIGILMEAIKNKAESPEEYIDMHSTENAALRAKAVTLSATSAALNAKNLVLRTKNLNLGERNAAANAEIDRLKNLDTREEVMTEVENILQQRKYAQFRYEIELDKASGIIRIPHNVIGFTSGGFRMGEGFTIVDIDEWERECLVGGCNGKSKRNLELLADLLVEIGNKVMSKELAIDAIYIECHSDQNKRTKSGNTVSTYYNDGLSIQRAFAVWRWLDNESKRKLSGYRNDKKLGLFSLSGFGDRVPLPERNGESEAAYNDRCRRIEIRFSCSPRRVREPSFKQ